MLYGWDVKNEEFYFFLMRSKNNIAKKPYFQKAPLIENGRLPHPPLFHYFILDKGIREEVAGVHFLLRDEK